MLLLFGLLFLAAEVIFIPGTTIVGFVGFALLAVGVWMGYRDLGTPLGHYALVGVALLAGVIVYVGLRPKNLSRLALHSVNDTTVDDARRADVAPGTVGHTLSALRPSGTVLFGTERREVVTRGEFVASGSAVRVLAIEQNRIVVATA
ncbi:NfeD-like C-terminal, partner-binding [Hymenobacter arizonensis]|uniref:NfeD-like C-terminal, partner-binding n=2 Tax=Hymenobacter arizonensis TaxID=1227077 RepID=A0A1I6B6K7_HYMAR|nr:NfeD-like C-terminal, partner-binding [Hymenobacter arizonensis]